MGYEKWISCEEAFQWGWSDTSKIFSNCSLMDIARRKWRHCSSKIFVGSNDQKLNICIGGSEQNNDDDDDDADDDDEDVEEEEEEGEEEKKTEKKKKKKKNKNKK